MRYSAVWQILGNFLHAGSIWIGFIILARVSNPEQVGWFAYAMSITAPIYMFFNLRLRLVLSTDTNGKFEREQYILLRIISSVAALTVAVLLAVFLSESLELFYLVLIIAIAKLVEGVSDIFYGYFQSMDRSELVGKSLSLKSAISVALSITIVLTFKNAIGLGMSLMCSWLVVIVVFDLYKMRSLGAKLTNYSPNFSDLRKILVSVLPLGFVALFSSLTTNMSRYFIEYFLGMDSLGIYAALAYFSSAAALFAAGLGQPKLKQLASAFNEGNIAKFRYLLYILIGIGALFGSFGILVAVFYGDVVLNILYGEGYELYSDIFVLLLVVSTLTMIALFQWYAITAQGSYRPQLIVSAFVAVLSAILLYGLVPKFGMEGAVWAEIIYLSIQIIIFFYLIEKSCLHVSDKSIA